MNWVYLGVGIWIGMLIGSAVTMWQMTPRTKKGGAHRDESW